MGTDEWGKKSRPICEYSSTVILLTPGHALLCCHFHWHSQVITWILQLGLSLLASSMGMSLNHFPTGISWVLFSPTAWLPVLPEDWIHPHGLLSLAKGRSLLPCNFLSVGQPFNRSHCASHILTLHRLLQLMVLSAYVNERRTGVFGKLYIAQGFLFWLSGASIFEEFQSLLLPQPADLTELYNLAVHELCNCPTGAEFVSAEAVSFLLCVYSY